MEVGEAVMLTSLPSPDWQRLCVAGMTLLIWLWTSHCALNWCHNDRPWSVFLTITVATTYLTLDLRRPRRCVRPHCLQVATGALMVLTLLASEKGGYALTDMSRLLLQIGIVLVIAPYLFDGTDGPSLWHDLECSGYHLGGAFLLLSLSLYLSKC
jgi:hypothetical protein